MDTYLDIAKGALNDLVDTLLRIEPYWNRCFPCSHKGKCCIGADPSIREDEWIFIQQCIVSFTPEKRQLLQYNISNHVCCPFRTDNECLIHDCRPLNCIFTPFQAIIGADRCLHYSTISSDCSFHRLKIAATGINAKRQFITLPNANGTLHYILLNHWYENFEKSPFSSRPASEWLANQ